MASAREVTEDDSTGSGVCFNLGIDEAVYPAATASSPVRMNYALTFVSTVSPPVVLKWFSLQRYDVLITGCMGAKVYRWSAGRAFPDIASNEPVLGEKQWVVDATLADSQGVPLPVGPYVIRADLVNRKHQRNARHEIFGLVQSEVTQG